MVEFTLNISHKGKSYKKNIADKEADVFKGKKLGDKIPGDGFGLSGYELLISGGSDKSGFPMRKDVESMTRKRILITSGVGLRKGKKGVRKRRTVTGSILSDRIKQINLNVVKEGKKNLDIIFGKEVRGLKKMESEEQKQEDQEEEEEEEKKEEEEKEEGEEEEGEESSEEGQ